MAHDQGFDIRVICSTFAVKFNPDEIWDAPLLMWALGCRCVNRLAWSADGQYLASGSDDRNLQVDARLYPLACAVACAENNARCHGKAEIHWPSVALQQQRAAAWAPPAC